MLATVLKEMSGIFFKEMFCVWLVNRKCSIFCARWKYNQQLKGQLFKKSIHNDIVEEVSQFERG